MADFAETIGHMMIARARVRAIPPAGLSDARKKKRQGQLSELRVAIEILVTAKYENLSQEAKTSADELIASAKAMKSELEGLEKVSEILNTVASFLSVARGFFSLISPR